MLQLIRPVFIVLLALVLAGCGYEGESQPQPKRQANHDPLGHLPRAQNGEAACVNICINTRDAQRAQAEEWLRERKEFLDSIGAHPSLYRDLLTEEYEYSVVEQWEITAYPYFIKTASEVSKYEQAFEACLPGVNAVITEYDLRVVPNTREKTAEAYLNRNDAVTPEVHGRAIQEGCLLGLEKANERGR